MARIIVLALLILGTISSAAHAQEPGWWGVVIAPRSIRPQIESTPIINRPYRPFHFYGNTIRRRYYRGTGILLPRDVVQGGRALVRGS